MKLTTYIFEANKEETTSWWSIRDDALLSSLYTPGSADHKYWLKSSAKTSLENAFFKHTGTYNFTLENDVTIVLEFGNSSLYFERVVSKGSNIDTIGLLAKALIDRLVECLKHGIIQEVSEGKFIRIDNIDNALCFKKVI